MELKNKIAVVTGGSRGIGRAAATELGRRGARIAICARDAQTLQQTASDLEKEGIEVYQAPCDVRKREAVDEFIGQVNERLGAVDILVNNAGVGGPTPISEDSDKRWKLLLAVNLDGPYYFSKAALRTMPDGGRIVNISSVLGKFGVPGYLAYCSAKHGIVGFTRALSLELASRKITVNAICPGWVDTRMAREGMEAGAKASGITYEEFRKRALADVPLGEMINPAEIADLIGFLASPAARNITGQAYNQCGGQVMH